MVDLTTFSNNVDSTRFEQTMQSTRTAGVKPLYISDRGIPKRIERELRRTDEMMNEGRNIDASLFYTKDGVKPAYTFIGDWVSNSSQVLVYYQPRFEYDVFIPPTFLEDVSLLLTFDEDAGPISDWTGRNHIVASKDLTVVSGKWGNGRDFINANQSEVTVAAVDDSLNIGTQDFTLEYWIRTSNDPDTTGITFFADPDNNLRDNSLDIGGGNGILNQFPGGGWAHVAIVRESGNVTGYVNGVVEVQFSGPDAINFSNLAINYNSLQGGLFNNMQLDDFRISKGLARYTAPFTPPTEPFEAVAPEQRPVPNEIEARYVKFTINSSQDGREPAINEIWITDKNQDFVLSKTETVTTSSDFSATYPGSKALNSFVDKILGTEDNTADDRWISGTNNTGTLEIDMGSIKSLSNIFVLGSGYLVSNNGRAPLDWEISTSTDGVTYNTFYSTASEPAWSLNEIRLYEAP